MPLRGDGNYVLVLKFAEVYFNAPDQKVGHIVVMFSMTWYWGRSSLIVLTSICLAGMLPWLYMSEYYAIFYFCMILYLCYYSHLLTKL